VVLRPHFPISAAQVLTFLAAVAAARAIRALHHIPVVLKWPNDLVVDGKKLGGILTEATGRPRMRYVVVGVGLNVNNGVRDFPRPLRATATSIRVIAGHSVERAPLLRRILEEMDRRYSRLLAEGSSGWLMDEWRALTPMVGKIVRVRHLFRESEGTVAGVDSDGALLLRTPAGTVERILAGDVTYLRAEDSQARVHSP